MGKCDDGMLNVNTPNDFLRIRYFSVEIEYIRHCFFDFTFGSFHTKGSHSSNPRKRKFTLLKDPHGEDRRSPPGPVPFRVVPPRVLVADDNRLIREITEAELIQCGARSRWPATEWKPWKR